MSSSQNSCIILGTTQETGTKARTPAIHRSSPPGTNSCFCTVCSVSSTFRQSEPRPEITWLRSPSPCDVILKSWKSWILEAKLGKNQNLHTVSLLHIGVYRFARVQSSSTLKSKLRFFQSGKKLQVAVKIHPSTAKELQLTVACVYGPSSFLTVTEALNHSLFQTPFCAILCHTKHKLKLNNAL